MAASAGLALGSWIWSRCWPQKKARGIIFAGEDVVVCRSRHSRRRWTICAMTMEDSDADLGWAVRPFSRRREDSSTVSQVRMQGLDWRAAMRFVSSLMREDGRVEVRRDAVSVAQSVRRRSGSKRNLVRIWDRVASEEGVSASGSLRCCEDSRRFSTVRGVSEGVVGVGC